MHRPEGRWARRLAPLLVLLALAGCAPAATPPEEAEPSDQESGGPNAGAPTEDGSTASGGGRGQGDQDGAGGQGPRAEGDGDDDHAALRGQLEGLLREARGELDDARLGIAVVAGSGEPLLDHGAEESLLPASTLKLVTAATLLTTLGPDARLPTTVETTGPVDPEGVVRGDLYLVGSGDPALATPEYGRWVYPARPRTPLEALADQLADAGVQRVAGDLVGTAEGYGGPRVAEGWRDNYLPDFDARHIAGLTVDAGLATRVTWPDPEDEDDQDEGDGDDPGAPDDESDTDPGDRDGSETDEGEADGLVVMDDDGPPVMRPAELDEEVEPERVRVVHAENPARQAAADLGRLLEERGIELAGEVRATAPSAPVVGTLARVHSPPLSELLRFMVRRSDNHLADTLLQVAGHVRTGEGSWERGERASRQVLEHLGVPTRGVRLADGSGLSRDDRLTAEALVALNRRMLASRDGETWASLMAVAGEGRGTLRTRLRGTPAQGRLLAKTGSLRDVAALSGFVEGDEDRRHHFAVLANDATGADRAVVRAFTDELGLLLAAELQACRTAPGSGEDGPLGRPPLAAAC